VHNFKALSQSAFWVKKTGWVLAFGLAKAFWKGPATQPVEALK